MSSAMGWPRYDPSLGFWLCEHCWNRGPQGLKHPYWEGLCQSPRTDMKRPKKVKFTGERQITFLE